ncbi:helix-turn-helix domain-containing protein [Neobacillus drentensis]|uniref:helix-turn-helix domain-containing protein n=1 Tax=Neobacillus drentensis TaxID=220684 RepID=UPI002FFE457D
MPLYNHLRTTKGARNILSDRLYKLRKKYDLKQDDVADIIGVVRSTYSNYEQGTREMDYVSLIKLADYYKVSLDYMFGRTDLPYHENSYSPEEIEFMERALNLYQEMKIKYK